MDDRDRVRRRDRARRRRQVRRQRRGLALALAVITTLTVGITAHSLSASSKPLREPVPTSKPMREPVATSKPMREPVAGSTPVRGPFASSAMTRFLAHRTGNITAAVDDVTTGQIFLYRAGVRQDTASIIKVSILATILHQAQLAGRQLTEEEQEAAAGMIEDSDDADATALWNAAGKASGVGAFIKLAGLTQTTFDPGGAWGLTLTTPLDQVRLLKVFAGPNGLLTPPSREYALSLMSNVIPLDYWGISSGTRDGVLIALKNGWLPWTSQWQVNSIGIINGYGQHYLIAVMTNDNPTENYGIATISGISELVWDQLSS